MQKSQLSLKELVLKVIRITKKMWVFEVASVDHLHILIKVQREKNKEVPDQQFRNFFIWALVIQTYHHM